LLAEAVEVYGVYGKSNRGTTDVEKPTYVVAAIKQFQK